MDKEILNIIRRLIASGYSKKVRDEAVEKAKKSTRSGLRHIGYDSQRHSIGRVRCRRCGKLESQRKSES